MWKKIASSCVVDVALMCLFGVMSYKQYAEYVVFDPYVWYFALTLLLVQSRVIFQQAYITFLEYVLETHSCTD